MSVNGEHGARLILGNVLYIYIAIPTFPFLIYLADLHAFNSKLLGLQLNGVSTQSYT